ncbi:hypothetical protein FB451DRAFT_1181435 [Mycena latifolia]|nr:hypothetical protein FB451DRAFT_1181435 [Mycena latifolia]
MCRLRVEPMWDQYSSPSEHVDPARSPFNIKGSQRDTGTLLLAASVESSFHPAESSLHAFAKQCFTTAVISERSGIIGVVHDAQQALLVRKVVSLCFVDSALLKIRAVACTSLHSRGVGGLGCHQIGVGRRRRRRDFHSSKASVDDRSARVPERRFRTEHQHPGFIAGDPIFNDGGAFPYAEEEEEEECITAEKEQAGVPTYINTWKTGEEEQPIMVMVNQTGAE